jgi:hypothetical protein
MTGKPISSALAIPSSTLPTQPRLFHQTSFTHLEINESLCLTNIICLKRRQGFGTVYLKNNEQPPNDLPVSTIRVRSQLVIDIKHINSWMTDHNFTQMCLQLSNFDSSTLTTSVGDPDPDPHVFGPPRTRSISQRSGSRSFLFLMNVLSGLK